MLDKKLEQLQTFEPIDFVDARQYAVQRFQALASEYAPTSGEQIAPPELTNHFFALQGKIEKQGHMDYRTYAAHLWGDVLGSIDEQDEGFQHFKGTLISSLHNIDMSGMVYPAVTSSISGLLDLYGDEIRKVGIWSTGDVTATGYQLAKIERSAFRTAFFGSFVTRAAGTEYARNKTFYMVHDDKFNGLANLAEDMIDRDNDDPLKIVIIEDSVKNFSKAQKALDDRYGENQAVVVPVWFTGSREGQAATAAAELEGTEALAELDAKKNELNAISSFDELLNSDRFLELLSGSCVMLDFDGVVGDNIAMRVEQSRVTFNALLEGAQISTGLSVDELTSSFLAALKN